LLCQYKPLTIRTILFATPRNWRIQEYGKGSISYLRQTQFCSALVLSALPISSKPCFVLVSISLFATKQCWVHDAIFPTQLPVRLCPVDSTVQP
jgi:hypothetical protein